VKELALIKYGSSENVSCLEKILLELKKRIGDGFDVEKNIVCAN